MQEEIVTGEYFANGRLLQAAGNASGQIARPEHPMQLMRRIFEHCAAARGGRVDYNAVKTAILRSKPKNADCLPFMFTLITKHAGGSAGTFFAESEMFLQSVPTLTTPVTSDFFSGLQVDVRGPNQVILARHAMLKGALSKEAVFTVSDVRRALGKELLPQTIIANGLMADARDVIKGSNSTLMKDGSVVTLLGHMDINLMSWALDKKPVGQREKLENSGSIVHRFVYRIGRCHEGTDYDEQVGSLRCAVFSRCHREA